MARMTSRLLKQWSRQTVPTLRSRAKARRSLLVFDQFHGGQHADSAHLSDQWVIGEVSLTAAWK
jgi:hypothetical protein